MRRIRPSLPPWALDLLGVPNVEPVPDDARLLLQVAHDLAAQRRREKLALDKARAWLDALPCKETRAKHTRAARKLAKLTAQYDAVVRAATALMPTKDHSP